jgi:hypothetical protein
MDVAPICRECGGGIEKLDGIDAAGTQPGPKNRLHLDDPGIAAAPIVAVAAEQADALALALNDQAIAVIFDLMELGGRRGDARASGGEAGQERRSHASKIAYAKGIANPMG